MEKTKVLVADGQRLFGDALAVALRAFPHVDVVDALPISGHDALRATLKHSPDVVVLDYWISGMPATAATAAILRHRPKTKVMVLGWLAGAPEEAAAHEAGAAAFLYKTLHCSQLLAALEEAPRDRNSGLPKESTSLSLSKRAEPLWRSLAELKPREVEVIELLVFGLTRDEIAAHLGIAPRTVRNLIHGVLAKTGARSQSEAIHLTVGVGGITPLERDARFPTMPSRAPARDSLHAGGYPRVLVADQQILFADAIARALREWWVPVIDEQPATPEEVLDAVARHEPEVVLLDYWLEGPATTEKILAVWPDTKVVMLSWLFSAPQVREALEAGVTGFLPKYVTVPVVAAAVRSSAAGETLTFAASVAAWLDRLGAAPETQAAARRRFERVTAREFQVLALLEKGHSADEIAERLSIKRGTAKNLVWALLRKTGAGSQADVLTLARAAGLIGI